jgi:hypothetical protein
MKRLVLLHCLLFSILFYAFNIACIVENIPAKPQTFASPYPSSNFFTKKQYDEKGFCGNTLVQTPYGYKPIKNLVKDDVVINCNGQEKRIVAITKKYVDQYVKIVVDNTTIYSGCDQCYYAFPVSIWFSAKRIWTGAKLFNNNSELCEVTHAELIYKKALLYQLLKILVATEMQLSNNQKENLRTLREINLQHLEQEIINLQSILALHADELIKQINVARDEYKEEQEQISNVTALWNDNLNNITYAIALQSYKADLLEEHLLNNLNQKLNELKIVAQYYTSCVNTMCIEQSTNIIQLLEKLVPVIIECDQWVVTEKSRVTENINVVEEHFARQSISVPHLKNGIKNELAKGRNGRNAQAIAEAKNKLASIAVSGGPNKNNNKNDDDKDEQLEPVVVQISKDDIPHMFANRPGHLIDTPANRQLLIELSSSKKNFLGLDNYGTAWYAKIVEDGKQLWTAVRGNLIRNGGINNVPREFHVKTGLCRFFK